MNVTKEMNIQIRLLVEDSQQLIKLKDKNESHQNEYKKKKPKENGTRKIKRT